MSAPFPLAPQGSRGAAARSRDAGETERDGLWGWCGRGLRNEGAGLPPTRHFGRTMREGFADSPKLARAREPCPEWSA